MITTTCYNKKETWPSAKIAIRHFTIGTYSCDNGSSEQERYYNIITKLELGFTDVDDSELTMEEIQKAITL